MSILIVTTNRNSDAIMDSPFLHRFEYDTTDLVNNYELPVMHHLKEYLYNLLKRSLQTSFNTKIAVDQINSDYWHLDDNDPSVIMSTKEFEARQNTYEYSYDSNATHWWVNFSRDRPFVAYNAAMFAQDEIQTAEHPILCHLKEALQKEGVVLRQNGRCDPLLIRGIIRCALIDTTELYGRKFTEASKKTVYRAVSMQNPVTTTNIICMTAHPISNGAYTLEQLYYMYRTCHAAFRGINTVENNGDISSIHVVHTGHWECGVFGGNRIVTALIQILAIVTSDVSRLVYHTFEYLSTAISQ